MTLRIRPQRRSATALRRAREGESTRTIVIAFFANLIIAGSKLAAGLVSGSTGMLAEAAHSGADSVNEIFLAFGLHRDRKPPDETHPMGHGRERFLWAFMASIASFLVGGCVSIFLAITHLKGGSEIAGPWPWIVLGVAFVADGISWLQAFRQARTQAKEYGISVWRYLGGASDPVVRAIAIEDSAALIGVLLAAAGLLLSRILGSSVPDALASLLIGILLTFTALAVGRPLADFLVGRSIPPWMFDKLETMFREERAIEGVVSLHAIYTGPEEAVVLAKVRPSRGMNIDQLSRVMDELDRRIRRALPIVADVFIDVTATRDAEEEAAPVKIRR
jgi:cation diffusion facilitator family transporter